MPVKAIMQFMLILLISLIGEALSALIPLPVPASIYGIVLMLLLLITGVIRVHQVKEAASFLIEIMPVMFIPAAVALMQSWGFFLPSIGAYAVIIVVSTFAVMGVSGRVAQRIIKKNREENRHA